MSTSTTTYMLLVLPGVSSEPGPDYATEINNALTSIDSHDHTSGKGTQITPSGMNINANLSFAGNSATNLFAAFLQSQSASLSSSNVGCLYRVGTNLWFNNGAGTAVQITSGSSVNASGTGVISSSTPSAYPYTVVTGDAQKVLLVDTTANRTLNLPAATNNMWFVIKDVSGSAQTHNITVTPNGVDTIEGAASFVVNWNYGAVELVSDGISQWFVV